MKPQFAGRNGEIAIPFAASNAVHAPSDPKSWPARAAKRQHSRAGFDDAFAIRRLEPQRAAIVPTDPTMAERELHALRIQPA